jgi:glycyl-tRNA synthetase
MVESVRKISIEYL